MVLNLTSENAHVTDIEPVPPGTEASASPTTEIVGGVEPEFPSGDVVLPSVIVATDAEFPSIAKQARIEGKVILQAVIDVDGRVRKIEVVSSSNPLFNAPAIEAVSQRLYAPARSGGKPLPIYFTVRLDFRLR
jgi:protein TonB